MTAAGNKAEPTDNRYRADTMRNQMIYLERLYNTRYMYVEQMYLTFYFFFTLKNDFKLETQIESNFFI